MKNNRKTKVAMHRALQFMISGGTPYHCTAGDTLFAVQPNGDMMPCRRLPIVVGNVFRSGMQALYFDAPLFRELRDANRISAECRKCHYAPDCRGGLRCFSYAVFNDPFRADPGCWIAHDKTIPRQ